LRRNWARPSTGEPAVEIAERPQRLARPLLKNAADVSKVLGKRSDKLNTLLLNGNDLLGVLNERRLAISNLLANTSVVASS
jgi:ABC-type transporter Mla subunit MlaD